LSKYKDLEARVANLEKLQRMLNYAIDGYNKSRFPVQEKPYTGIKPEYSADGFVFSYTLPSKPDGLKELEKLEEKMRKRLEGGEL
jgi:hypothetical protein